MKKALDGINNDNIYFFNASTLILTARLRHLNGVGVIYQTLTLAGGRIPQRDLRLYHQQA